MHSDQARDLGRAQFDTMSSEMPLRLSETAKSIAGEPGIYRRNFRAPKR